jgi:hypothetical protein
MNLNTNCLVLLDGWPYQVWGPTGWPYQVWVDAADLLFTEVVARGVPSPPARSAPALAPPSAPQNDAQRPPSPRPRVPRMTLSARPRPALGSPEWCTVVELRTAARVQVGKHFVAASQRDRHELGTAPSEFERQARQQARLRGADLSRTSRRGRRCLLLRENCA